MFGHGGNGTTATTPLEIASITASHGLALITINLVGHGRGPASTLTLKMVGRLEHDYSRARPWY